MSDFDKSFNRKNTNSIKFDGASLFGKSESLLPLWVADMDFQAPTPVLDALKQRVEHGIFGYSYADDAYKDSVCNWFKRRHGMELEPEWIVSTPGVVFAISSAITAFTKPGDKVLIQPPVYYPFASSTKSNGRTLVESPLCYRDGAYSMDFANFEHQVIEEKPKLFILCNPHNPVGRAWSKEELQKIADICIANNVLIVSDEIHADFNRPGIEHISMASLGDEVLEKLVLCTAPSKTFNLAGLQTSNIFIPNKDMRKQYKSHISRMGLDDPNVLGLVAAKACYDQGDNWLDDLKAYLEKNLAFVKEFLEEQLPSISLIEPQSTYLIWLDCSKLGLTHEQLCDLFENKAGLWLDDGAMFGKEGRGFMRINIATQTTVLKQAFTQLKNAVDALN